MHLDNIKNILVPIDFSPASLVALEHAKYVAKETKAVLNLLHVHETPNFSSSLKKLLFKSDDDQQIVENSVDQDLKEIAAGLPSDLAHNVMIRKASSKIYKEIIEAAREIRADLILIGTHGSTITDSFVGGSNTFRVACLSQCPVISVHSDSGNRGIKNIVLPLDNSRETREKVDDAIAIAKLFKSTIHLTTVSVSHDEVVKNRLMRVTEQVKNYIEEDKIEVITNYFVGENITELTLRYANKISADLIVIMTEQESNFSGIFMGPTSQQMINHSYIPVMSIRPKDTDGAAVAPY